MREIDPQDHSDNEHHSSKPDMHEAYAPRNFGNMVFDTLFGTDKA